MRRCSEPNEKVKQIYQALNYKPTPFKKKKVVVHKLELKKMKRLIFRMFGGSKLKMDFELSTQ